MRKYELEVLQILRRTVDVEANSYEEAKAIVEHQRDQGELTLEGDTQRIESWIEIDPGKEIEKSIEEKE